MNQSSWGYLAGVAAMAFVAIYLMARQWQVRRLARARQPKSQRIPAPIDSNF